MLGKALMPESEKNEDDLMNINGEFIPIGNIGNYYGKPSVAECGNKKYWSIDNWDGHKWEEIPDSLYDELIKFNEVK